jgi:hypothetical protein
MRVPQVSERIKEAPAQALRGVFAGIGQLLLYTDKLRNKAPFGQKGQYARPPEPPQPTTPRTAPEESVPDGTAASAPADRDVAPEPAVAETPRTPKTPAAPKSPAAPGQIRDFDKTGNVRLISGDEARAHDEPPTAEQPAAAAAAEPAPAAPPAAEEPAAVAAATDPAAAEPPLPNYDQMSIASLRARLRNLDVTQLRGLIEYERGHAGRPDVLTMLERRIAKLEAGD